MELLDPTDELSFMEKPRIVYAGFWARFGASVLDGLIVGIPMALVNYGLFGGNRLIFLNNLLVGWLYSALQESSPKMATLGKRAINLKVTTVNGGRLTFAQATGRHFGKLLSTIILLIGYFMMLWDDKKQTLHDKLANTVVIAE